LLLPRYKQRRIGLSEGWEKRKSGAGMGDFLVGCAQLIREEFVVKAGRMSVR